MSEPLVVSIPLIELPPTPNRARGMHWSTRGRLTKAARKWAGFNAREARLRWLPVGTAIEYAAKRSCRIEIIYPTSRRGPMTDPDSALARLKPLIDGLVDAGCLRGDGPADVSYEPIQQRKEGKQLIVRFHLSPIEESPKPAMKEKP